MVFQLLTPCGLQTRQNHREQCTTCKHSVFRVEMSWNFCYMARHEVLSDSVLFSSADISPLRCNCYQAVGVESLMTCLMLLFGIFVELYILLHTTVQIKDDERTRGIHLLRTCHIWCVAAFSFENYTHRKSRAKNPSSVQYSVDFITVFRKLYVLW
jgi:hypothetical protein